MIDFTTAQTKMTRAGFAPGPIDGDWGPSTLRGLMSVAAARVPDMAIRSISVEGAVQLPLYSITDTKERLCEFLAETCHETGGWKRFEENMCYSAKRLTQVWPNRFPTLASALPYAWDPTDPDREDIVLANYVYGARMGNEADGTADNDGWDHRGGGQLQHTGAAEYEALRKIGLSPDDVRDPTKSVKAACDYWKRRKLNSIIDTGDFVKARKAINGGTIGLQEIKTIRNHLLMFFS